MNILLLLANNKDGWEIRYITLNPGTGIKYYFVEKQELDK